MSAVLCPQCACELELVSRVAPPSNDASETFGAWAARWFAARRAHGAIEERRRFRYCIEPLLGALDVRRLARSDVETWVERQDAAVAAGEIRWGTARRRWIQLRRMLGDMSRSKVRELRVRSDDPAAEVRGPDRGAQRAGTFLYPSEFLRLIRCRSVPIAARRLYAVAVYLYPRAGELRALEWNDVDLRTGRVHIHRTYPRGARGPRETKTGCVRHLLVERALLPLLRSMRRRAKGRGRLFSALPSAQALREHLLLAGCDRAALHAPEDDGTRRRLNLHDLRATGITWQAMRGDTLPDIMDRVGHVQMATTQGYIRRGRMHARGRGEITFPRLPRELF